MATKVPTVGRPPVYVYVVVVGLFLATFMLPTADTGCPTIRLSGSTNLYPKLFVGTYTMLNTTSLDHTVERPVYRNDESKSPLFFKQDYWHAGSENRIRVRDASFYPEDITGTFEIWDSGLGQFVEDPQAHFRCADITYICKDDKKTIRCPRPNFQKLLIVRATYGQDFACKSSGCIKSEADCTSCFWTTRNDVLGTVQGLCSGRSENCVLEASDEMFRGNPCGHIEGNVDTYLRVEHKCVNVPMSLGCYQDDPTDNPLLSGPANSQSNMTIQKCLTFCRLRSQQYGGVVNRFACRCGNQLRQGAASRRLPITNCTALCGGDQSQFCGGPTGSQKMEVFETSIGRCGDELKTNQGIIYSPDFPGPYPPNQNCTWNIQVSSANVIRISLELLDISTGDSLTITENRSSGNIVTVLNGTSITDYVSVSSEVSVQFQAGPLRVQQGEGFILRYKGVGHCGPIAVSDDVISVSPSHGGNFAIGQQATISCKNGLNVTVVCQKDGAFSVSSPYCSDPTMWMAIVGGIVAVLVLLAIVTVAAILIIRKRKSAQKQHSGTAAYSAAPVSDSLDLTSGSSSARARGDENEAGVGHEYASIRDTSSPSAEPLYAQPDNDKPKHIELLYAKPIKHKKNVPSGKEEEGIVDNILYESSVGEDRSERAKNGEQQGLIENDMYG